MPLHNDWSEIFSEKPVTQRVYALRCEPHKLTSDPTHLTANDPEPPIVFEPIAHRRMS